VSCGGRPSTSAQVGSSRSIKVAALFASAGPRSRSSRGCGTGRSIGAGCVVKSSRPTSGAGCVVASSMSTTTAVTRLVMRRSSLASVTTAWRWRSAASAPCSAATSPSCSARIEAIRRPRSSNAAARCDRDSGVSGAGCVVSSSRSTVGPSKSTGTAARLVAAPPLRDSCRRCGSCCGRSSGAGCVASSSRSTVGPPPLPSPGTMRRDAKRGRALAASASNLSPMDGWM